MAWMLLTDTSLDASELMGIGAFQAGSITHDHWHKPKPRYPYHDPNPDPDQALTPTELVVVAVVVPDRARPGRCHSGHCGRADRSGPCAGACGQYPVQRQFTPQFTFGQSERKLPRLCKRAEECRGRDELDACGGRGRWPDGVSLFRDWLGRKGEGVVALGAAGRGSGLETSDLLAAQPVPAARVSELTAATEDLSSVSSTPPS